MNLTIFDHDQWREVDLALVYQQNGFLDGVTTATLDVTQGLDILGASPAGDPNVSHAGAVPDFTKLSGVVRRIQEIYGPLSFALTGTGQYAFQPLYVGEEISFGGAQIGRGYDPAAITGDMGVGGDAELRYKLDISGRHIDSPRVTISHAELYAFYDVAKVWDHDAPIVGPNFLESAGFRRPHHYRRQAAARPGGSVPANPGADERLRQKSRPHSVQRIGEVLITTAIFLTLGNGWIFVCILVAANSGGALVGA